MGGKTMTREKKTVAFLMALVCLGLGIWVMCLRQRFVTEFDARQEILEKGSTTMGRACYVKHTGFMNIGVRYALVKYPVDGESYECELRFAQNYQKLPHDVDPQGEHIVLVSYDAANPGRAAIACAQKGWKLAKASLLILTLLLWSYALIFMCLLGKGIKEGMSVLSRKNSVYVTSSYR